MKPISKSSAIFKSISTASAFMAWSGLSLLLLSQGCRPSPPGPLDDLPSMEGLHHDPAKDPSTTPSSQDDVGLSHILVTYAGAFNPQVRTNRDYRQALERAKRLAKLARTKEMDFADLAHRFSDDAKTSLSGGDLGVISPGQIHPDLEQAAFSLGLGQVSGPIHTPTGYHVLLRHEATEAQVSEIVISYVDAKRYTPRTPRSRELALQLAEQIHQGLLDGESFEDAARKYSDMPNYARGGFFPIFAKGTQQEKFEEIVWPLPVGGISKVIETPTGFHIVKRWHARRINLRMIEFPYRTVAPEDLVEYIPDRNEALHSAERFLLDATRPDADFVEVIARALAYNNRKDQGARQEKIGRGTLPLAIEQAAFALEVGQISDIVEADSSFVVVKRVP